MNPEDVDRLERLCGEVLADRYRVESVLGIGGMAGVLRAVHVDTGAPVALKVLLPTDEHNQGFLRRFVREARVASRLEHPHIVRVQEVGRWEHGRPFIAMDLIEGCALHDLLDVGLETGVVCSLMVQVLDALAFVHARGVLHRDIKPDNILVSRRTSGRLSVKLADFGIAASMDELEGDRLTQEGTLIGTPDFMAPEQVHARGFVGPTADLYPVGIILFRMIAGRDPFEGKPLQRLMARLSREPPALQGREGEPLPEGLDLVVARFMARQVADRYQSAAAGRAALLPFCHEPRIDDDEWWEISDGRASTLPPEVSLGGGELTDDLWGRDVEVGQLGALAATVTGGEARVALVRGDVGIGKSALVAGFAVREAEAGRFTVLQGGYQRAAGAEVGVRGALERFLGTTGRDRGYVEGAVRGFLEQQGIHDPDEVSALTSFLRPAVGERLPRNESFARVVRVLRAMTRHRPVLLVLDDLPDGGPDACAFVEHLLFEAVFEPLPLLVLTTMRSGQLDEAVEASLDQLRRYEGGLVRSIRVGPIDDEILQAALVRSFDLKETAALRVAQRSGGNPLFARHLASAPEVTTTGKSLGGSTVSGEHLPDALRNILQRSLRERIAETRDPREAEDILVQLAVLGEHVSVDLVEAMTGATMTELDEVLDDLVEQAIVVEQGLDHVAFAHGLYRDAVLSRLSPRRLRRLHAQAARVRSSAPNHAADAGAIGEHHAAAGDLDAAVDSWLAGMAYEAAAGDATRGVRFGSAALEAMDESDDRRDECALQVARLHRDLGQMTAASEVLAPLVENATTTVALRAGEILAEIHHELGAGEAWSSLVELLQEKLAGGAVDDGGAFHRALAFRLNHQGDVDGAREAAEIALERSPAGPPALRAAIRLAWACKFSGRLDEARRAADRAAAEAGDVIELRAEALRMQLFTRRPTPGPQGTVPMAQRALELQRKSGRAARVVRGVCDLATALLMVHRQREALTHFEEAERLASGAGLLQMLGYIRLFAFVAKLELDEHEGLADEIELAKGRFVQVGSTGFVPLLELCGACAAAADGAIDRALGSLERAGRLDAAPFSNEFGRLMARLGMSLADANADADHAAPVLFAAARFLDERGLEDEARLCRARLTALEA